MEENKRLSVVIEHWIEHNQSHMGEYKKWAERAGILGLVPVKSEIDEAIKKLSLINHHLEKALAALTFPK
jgi:nickel/cobalt exporter